MVWIGGWSGMGWFNPDILFGDPMCVCVNIYIYIITPQHIEYGIGKLAIFGIPIIELGNGYLEYS